MGPEDQHPWDAQDEEIAQAFATKNAEIQRLKALIAELADALEASWKSPGLGEVAPGPMGKLLRHAREATRATIENRDAETERLKEHIIFLVGVSTLKNKLITELADALEGSSQWPPHRVLIQRAREAAR